VRFRRITLLIILVLSCFTAGAAQSSSVENLRSQLSDVQKKENEVQTRIRQVEEDMKPENLERAFALNGSTRPEELRAERRRQLESEKTRLQSQLDQLAQSRARLETAIATAEAAAYQQSAYPDSYRPAAPAVNPSSKTTVVKPKPTQRRPRQRARRARRRG
jgi:chromosome segregation ATPase